MVRSAMEHLNREVSYSEIKQRIWEEFPMLIHPQLHARSSLLRLIILLVSIIRKIKSQENE